MTFSATRAITTTMADLDLPNAHYKIELARIKSPKPEGRSNEPLTVGNMRELLNEFREQLVNDVIIALEKRAANQTEGEPDKSIIDEINNRFSD